MTSLITELPEALAVTDEMLGKVAFVSAFGIQFRALLADAVAEPVFD
jgi:hypothetical protein